MDINTLPEHVRDKFLNPIKSAEFPQITPAQVHAKIMKSKKTKSKVPGDLPKDIIQEFSPELADPVASIFQNIVQNSQWPSSWKTEYGIPLKKVKNPETEDELRIISLTNYFSKVFEQFEFVGDQLDSGQFGGIQGGSISHYLIELCPV